ncbi:hypothetical protein RHS01_08418 [Rhizoctonia solani]|uniref:Uncharacterized protein n=1 Tax=Rhizoctonia solani TaxID=456999 RepID=A0A8H7M1Y1_9AGAM|nr:hypothetical protein RHS01_08418 [Rhizoctonia solani]
MTWLTAEAPLIDWQQGLVTFPEQVQIASKEEADSDPLADLPPQYHEFAKVFGEEEFKVLPPHREYDISIDLVLDAKLSPGPIYGMTDLESKALKQHIDEELATGKIHPSTSSAGAPVMFVKKGWIPQAGCDYQKLNDLDLRWGYNNVQIKEGDKWKTAFRTKYGLFEYLVMPFGLTNTPAAFQHFMNDLFRDLIDVTVVIYLDDILIFSERPEEHPLHVKEVLSRLMKNQLSVAQPLHNLTKKETPWTWGNLEGTAFQELKVLVTNLPVLIHSNPELPYYLETDASGVAMGAILSQRGTDNRLHPIAYMSKLFSGAEANYDTHNKELLAIIKALEEWRIFLEATNKPVQVFTDHCNLEYWMQARTFNQRHARWRVFLSDFNFEIHYCLGKQSGKPDALSRRSNYVDTPPDQRSCYQQKLREDPSLESIITFLTEDADDAPPSIQKAYQDYDWEEDLLWYHGKLVVPDSEPLKEQLLREFHDSPLAGHPGQQRTLELVSRNYWWPGMKSSAKEWVKCCPVCQAN